MFELCISQHQQLCQVQTDEKLIEELESSDSPPASVLVNGTLMNSDEFREIWECDKTARMNIADKCILW